MPCTGAPMCGEGKLDAPQHPEAAGMAQQQAAPGACGAQCLVARREDASDGCAVSNIPPSATRARSG